MDPVDISAGRLQLRPWEAADVDDVLRGGSDPQTQRWTRVPSPYTRAHAEDFVCRYAPQQWAQDGELVWAVRDATTGEALASVGLHPADPEGVRRVGFWCLPEARGRGVVPDAVHAVARWAVAALGVARLEWAAQVGNAASLRVAEKAGFAYEGRRRASLRRADGSWCDGWFAARLHSDGPQGVAPALPDPGTLEAGPLRLRRWRPDDAGALSAALGGELPPPLPTPPPGLDPDAHVRWFVGELAPQWWAAGDGAPLAVLAQDGSVLGSLQLFLKGRRAGNAEVGVWVTPAARRQGVASAAIAAQLEWAVPALGLRRVEWHADPGNAPSQALADGLGFVREGLARSAFPGEPRGDSVVLARTW